jgi:hypothetical protein
VYEKLQTWVETFFKLGHKLRVRVAGLGRPDHRSELAASPIRDPGFNCPDHRRSTGVDNRSSRPVAEVWNLLVDHAGGKGRLHFGSDASSPSIHDYV